MEAMVTRQLSVQLYSVRDHLAELDRTLEGIASLGVDAVEPFNVLDRDLGPAMRRHGLTAPSAQFPFLSDQLELDGRPVDLPSIEVVFDAARGLGVELLIDPILTPTRWRAPADVERTADRLNAAADDAAVLGLRVGYHNHSFEFHARIDGLSAFEHFAARLDEGVVLELDVFWAAAAGEDVPALLGRLGERVRALHVKDGAVPFDPFATADGYDPAALDQRVAGQGELGLAEILAAAAWAELDVIEFDHIDGDVYEAIAASIDFVRQVRGRSGS